MKVERTPYYSWKTGRMSKGCGQCVKGRKTVIYITGLCSTKCKFCPLSEQRKDKDVIFINEWKTEKFDDCIKEIALCQSKGAGITGGDPLVKLDRTCEYISQLKKRLGRKFHIHLYTPLTLVDEEKLEKLFKAGLDEIRFHPSLDDDKLWDRILLAKKYKWDIGIEIPVIPGKKEMIIKLIDFAYKKIDFLNLNELEISDTNAQSLIEDGFKPKDDISYGIKGSEDLALELLAYAGKKNLRCHYCTCQLKDSVQLAKRIKLRAKSIKKSFDTITDAGTLIRGAIYLKGLEPGFDYAKRLEEADKEATLEKLNQLKMQHRGTEVDKDKLRLITSIPNANRIADEENKDLICAIVEEYPTKDKMIVELDFIDNKSDESNSDNDSEE